MTQTSAECTVRESWWWAEELPETCRVLCKNRFGILVHLVGFTEKKHLRILHVLQSKCLRIATSSPWYIRNRQIRGFGIYILYWPHQRFDSKLAGVGNPLVRHLSRYLPWPIVDMGLVERPKGDWGWQTCGYLAKGVISRTAELIARKSDTDEWGVRTFITWLKPDRNNGLHSLWLVHFFRWSLRYIVSKMSSLRAVRPRGCSLIPVRVSWCIGSPERPDRLLEPINPLFIVWWRLFSGR